MTATPGKVRRIVTGHTADGTATVIEDGEAPAVKAMPSRPGYYATNVWVTRESPCDIDAPDASRAHDGILPPKNGTILRIIDIPPEPADPAERARQINAGFKEIYGDATRPPTPEGGHPGMHRTRTVDYAVVLEGEICSVLEDREDVMKAGDVLIQRGTNHAWANRSGKNCRMLFVLIYGVGGPPGDH